MSRPLNELFAELDSLGGGVDPVERLDARSGQPPLPVGRPQQREFDLAQDFKDLDELATRTQEGFSGAGVPNIGFRTNLGRMDTPEESQNFLNREVGEQGWTQDRFGNYALTPAGQETLGLDPIDENLLIEDVGRFTLGDIADIRGDIPAIGGGLLMGIATGGAGFIPAVAATALGSAAFKSIDEAGDALKGDNLQTPGEIAQDIGRDTALTMAGETIARPIAAFGRKLLAPKSVDAARQELAKDAAELGVQPKASQLVGSKLLARVEGLMSNIFGDINEFKNIPALKKSMDNLIESAGKAIDREDLGNLIKTDIKKAKNEFSMRARANYKVFDDILGGNAVIPTAPIKQAAEKILSQFMRTNKGQLIGASGETLRELNKYADLPDFATGAQMQNLRSRLYDAARVKDLVPGVDTKMARDMAEAANESFDAASSPDYLASALSKYVDLPPGEIMDSQFFTSGAAQTMVDMGLKALRQADEFYATNIKKFDNNIVSRITRDPTIASSVDPELVVDTVFKKGRLSNIRRVMDVLPEESKGAVRRSAMETLLETSIDRGADPLEIVLTGAPLRRAIDKYGVDTLQEMFGKEMTDDLLKYTKVMQLVTGEKGKESGGLVAAAIALNPIQNLSTLARLRVMSKVMTSDKGFKWLTQGLEAPRSREAGMALTQLSALTAALAEDELNAEVQEFEGENPAMQVQQGQQIMAGQ